MRKTIPCLAPSLALVHVRPLADLPQKINRTPGVFTGPQRGRLQQGTVVANRFVKASGLGNAHKTHMIVPEVLASLS